MGNLLKVVLKTTKRHSPEKILLMALEQRNSKRLSS